MTADDLDMTGTAVSATTFLERQGVFPPFNSLDPLNGLPLGSAAITDLADLDLTISKLETRVPYYVRVAAVNALGQGPWPGDPWPRAQDMMYTWRVNVIFGNECMEDI